MTFSSKLLAWTHKNGLLRITYLNGSYSARLLNSTQTKITVPYNKNIWPYFERDCIGPTQLVLLAVKSTFLEEILLGMKGAKENCNSLNSISDT